MSCVAFRRAKATSVCVCERPDRVLMGKREMERERSRERGREEAERERERQTERDRERLLSVDVRQHDDDDDAEMRAKGFYPPTLGICSHLHSSYGL